MKIAVLTDAHGNQFGFSAALNDAKQNQVDLIVSAGDMLASFPGGPEILRTLVAEQIPIVLGNADELLLKWWLAEPISPLRSSPQFRPLQTSAARFTSADFTEIANWPLTQQFTAEGRSTLLCHGTPKSNRQSIESPDWSLVSDGLNLAGIDSIIAGHHHHQWSDTSKGVLLVLAGSCGMPCGGDTRAQYTILHLMPDKVRVQHRSVEYDRQRFAADLKAQDYARQASPIGWLELAQMVTAQPLMRYYFRDRFDEARGTDNEFLVWSVTKYLEEYGVLANIETEFGPLI
ncbi:MAG: metallophosphoesterase family protein [Caldilineaceae bacterium]